MVYCSEEREAVREWAQAFNWGTFANKRTPTNAQIPTAWESNSTSSRAVLAGRISGAITSLTNAQWTTGPHTLVVIVIWENDMFGVASSPANIRNTAVFLADSCCSSLESLYYDYKDNLCHIVFGKIALKTFF